MMDMKSNKKKDALKEAAKRASMAKDKKGFDKAADRKKKLDKFESDKKINKMIPGYGAKGAGDLAKAAGKAATKLADMLPGKGVMTLKQQDRKKKYDEMVKKTTKGK